ncbi:cupin domain-containing protein [Micromonospora sp. NPDC049101]|uniref:cupin domain-containing protein n=1 Tax=Micromonospora sp. NPDC049101 TaxID=3155032 RepID=UPI0033E63110
MTSIESLADGASTAVPLHRRPTDRPIGFARLADAPVDRRRGGVLRLLLSPRTVGSTSGFMGVATLEPGEWIAEHYHPYSEEFLYVVSGDLQVDLDGEPHPMRAEEALLVPPGTRHRLRNPGTTTTTVVYHLGPLAPRPELGHVDTEAGPTGGRA